MAYKRQLTAISNEYKTARQKWLVTRKKCPLLIIVFYLHY